MPEPKRISIERLRRVIGEADAAHAALAAASQRRRNALDDLKDARVESEAYDRAVIDRRRFESKSIDLDAPARRVSQKLAAAEAAFEAAELTYERARENWSAIGPLASSAREYASSRNLLPSDLKD